MNISPVGCQLDSLMLPGFSWIILHHIINHSTSTNPSSDVYAAVSAVKDKTLIADTTARIITPIQAE
jgi:hypothetical protein